MNVTVKLTGTLVARTGTREARVGVSEDATVGDVVEKLADKHGPQVRAGVLDGHRLRSDTVAIRESVDTAETLSTGSNLESGDTVRLSLNV
ncbi:MoaD/ThiS family protein [Halorussus halophilus]|uniref:MoaD/ThiS family protein n=1 Tax=Halorussus halophilus TaxID=2650975 RepID=UPI001301429C|nr:MoaD/ThiS family protein [Halorussus halophilus]